MRFSRLTLAILVVAGLIVAGVLLGCDFEPSKDQGLIGKKNESGAAEPPVVAAEQKVRTSGFSLTEEKVSDSPIKTQITQHLLATSPDVTEADLRLELERRYGELQRRTGFKHHNPATNYFIYIYGSAEQAGQQGIRWIAMFAKTPGTAAQIEISKDRLSALKAPSQVKFGLSEPKRREVFKLLRTASKEAEEKARKKFLDREFQRQFAHETQIREASEKKIAAKYGISVDNLRSISLEGFNLGW